MPHMVPIFDTSAVINLSKREHEDPVLKQLKLLLPNRGCPLSFVTALELFHGLNLGGIAKFDDSVKALIIAAQLSRRKVLLAPYAFVEKELFGVTTPGHERSRANVKRWLGVMISPDFKAKFSSRALGDIKLEKVENVFDFVRNGHSTHVEAFLTGIYPQWRSERAVSRSPIPEAMREGIKRAVPREEWKSKLPEQLLEAMGIERTAQTIETMGRGCDAYFTFTVNLLRDSLLTNYRFERNSNDFHDGLQLVYLCRPSFCLVTDDKRSISRAAKSAQASRILTIEQFVSSSTVTVKRVAAGG
jgi:hypothetical protein